VKARTTQRIVVEMPIASSRSHKFTKPRFGREEARHLRTEVCEQRSFVEESYYSFAKTKKRRGGHMRTSKSIPVVFVSFLAVLLFMIMISNGHTA
jgi:hypothetical protein